MKSQILLSLILLMAPAVFSEDHRYCELKTCPNRTHTLCQFPRFGLASSCRIPVSAAIDRNLITNIVNFHNYFRLSNVLKHRQNLRSQSAETNSSSSPYSLKWDEELAFIAQRWAGQCQNVTDKCRNIDRFNVTQRVDVQETLPNDPEPSVYTSIRRWHNQESSEDLNFQNLSLEEASNTTPNHTNRLAWGNTNRIGCGLVRTFDFTKQKLYFVCNFGYMKEN